MKRAWRSASLAGAAQLPLFAVPRRAAPAGANNLFLALRPDEEAAARIHRLTLRLRDTLQLKGAPFALDRLHVTLCYLGMYADLPQDLIAVADAAVRAIRCEPFELALDRVLSFPRRDEKLPLVLCRDGDCGPLQALHGSLATAIARTGGFPPENHRFRPHVTLLYDRRKVAEQAVAPVSWVVHDFVLIRSLYGRTRHEVLARYPLH